MSGDLTLSSIEAAAEGVCPEVRFLETTDSTNREALEWARKGAPAFGLVIADHQTAGRGRLGRSWFSVPGCSLLLSLVLRPAMPIDGVGLINVGAAVASAKAIEGEGPVARLKWPNDVLVRGKKLAGILSESEVESGTVKAVVLGIGINVNTPFELFPEDLRGSATSVMAETGRRSNRAELLSRLLKNLAGVLGDISKGRPDSVLAAYIPLCETLGKRVRVLIGTRTIDAIAVGIDPVGGLILDNGEVVRAGEVVHLR